MLVQVDLLLGCGSMVNDSVEMLHICGAGTAYYAGKLEYTPDL
jgi:hypothetical protein